MESKDWKINNTLPVIVFTIKSITGYVQHKCARPRSRSWKQPLKATATLLFWWCLHLPLMYITDLRLRICAREKGGREIYKTEPKRAIIVRNFAATLHTAIASPRTLRYSRSVRKRRISWRSKAAASLDVLFPIEHTTIPFCHSQPWQQTIYILFGLYMFRIQKRVSCSFTRVRSIYCLVCCTMFVVPNGETVPQQICTLE